MWRAGIESVPLCALAFRLAVLPLAVLGLTVLPTTAHGMCVGFSSGDLYGADVLPMRGRVYLFVRKGRPRPVYEAEDAQGRALPITWRVVSQALEHDVYRLEFRPLLPGRVRVFSREYDGARVERATYAVTERWTSEAPDVPVRILGQGSGFNDICPVTHTRDLAVSLRAPAYRVTFAYTSEDYVAGRTRSLVIPGESEVRYEEKQLVETGRGIVRLGDISCFGILLMGERSGLPRRHRAVVRRHRDAPPLATDARRAAAQSRGRASLSCSKNIERKQGPRGPLSSGARAAGCRCRRRSAASPRAG